MAPLSISRLVLHGLGLIPFYLTLTSAQEAPSGFWCPPKEDFDWESVRFASFCIEEILILCRSLPAKASTGPLAMIQTFARG